MSMNGFESIEYSHRGYGNKWLTKDTVETFLESDEVCVGKDFGADYVKAYEAFRQYVKNSNAPVKVFRRGTVIGLLKVEQ